MENVLIAYGQSGSTNFTSDSITPTAGHTDTDFPTSNVTQYDISEPWKTDWDGPDTTAGGIDYRYVNFYFDLLAAYKIDLFVILNHNFDDMATFASDNHGNFTVTLQASATNPGSPDWEVSLTNLEGIPTIAHRPEVTRQWWRLRMVFTVDEGTDVSNNQCYIGRMFLNSTAQCFQPDDNFDRNWSIVRHDPSMISNTIGGARRVVEMDQYRSIVLPFSNMGEDDWTALDTIYVNQGAKKPVFVSPSPHLIETGETAPGAGDYDPDAIYGYLPAQQAVNKYQMGEPVASITFNVAEAVY